MKTIKSNTLKFENNEIKVVLHLLLNNEYRIFKSYFKEDQNLTYFTYSKNDKIAYLQAKYSGIEISTVHKPCKNFGTGFGLNENHIINTTLEDLEEGFILCPKWEKGDTTGIKKYETLNDYFEYNKKFNDKNLVEIIK